MYRAHWSSWGLEFPSYQEAPVYFNASTFFTNRVCCPECFLGLYRHRVVKIRLVSKCLLKVANWTFYDENDDVSICEFLTGLNVYFYILCTVNFSTMRAVHSTYLMLLLLLLTSSSSNLLSSAPYSHVCLLPSEVHLRSHKDILWEVMSVKSLAYMAFPGAPEGTTSDRRSVEMRGEMRGEAAVPAEVWLRSHNLLSGPSSGVYRLFFAGARTTTWSGSLLLCTGPSRLWERPRRCKAHRAILTKCFRHNEEPSWRRYFTAYSHHTAV